MNNNRIAHLAGLLVLAATMSAGCATAPTEAPATEPEPAAETAPAVVAPSHEEAMQAIEDARAAIRRAEAEGALWRDSERLLADAEAALKAGDTARAIELAHQARRQAENAIEQKRYEEARIAASAAENSYEVVAGDSLWSISAKADIYGNPYHWPLIYKANRDTIEDADLIYPGQVFTIDRSASSSDMLEAARHARTRGAWSLGVVEESDKAYLAR
ncbi:MAG: LysM peptidoglycan-binding domain-containing protein [Thiohalomonadaceae bacterium]